ncbi:MAG: pilus assembly protein TadG-related protein [Bryobacteraceae bacterium]|nr:pilus assembly protein TadG-related protein [Bryobacteraceae bacterium]
MGAKSISAVRSSGRRGAISVQLLVLMVPVFFGLMGFAIDLGRLYAARAELKAASEAMALAAASVLIGTDASTGNAAETALRLIETDTGFGNKYDFGALNVGEANGSLNSEVVEPTFYDNVAAATGEGESTTGTSGEVSGSVARHVRVELVGETPLTMWRFLALGQEGKVAIRVRSVAGVSAPVCTACGIEPIAIAPVDAGDTTNFGFVVNTRYTLGYICTGAPVPQPLPNSTGGRVPYVILNRLNEEAEVFPDDLQQIFRNGAQGMVPSTNDAIACMRIAAEESIWATASQLACNVNRVQPSITAFLCGMAARMDNSLVQGCDTIPEVETLNSLYQPDTDLTDLDDYAGYTGNGRRVLTIPIVETLNPTGTMVVLGFRQFLLEPLQDNSGIAPNDPNGRIQVLYLGVVMPLKQGRFEASCTATGGPGKVVLHQ